jgi:hypothetical protein
MHDVSPTQEPSARADGGSTWNMVSAWKVPVRRGVGVASTLRRRVLPCPPAYRFTVATLRLPPARTVSVLTHMEENDRGVAIGMQGSLRTPARNGSRRAVLHRQALGARPLKGPLPARPRLVDPTTGPSLAGPSLERLFESPTHS